MAYKSKSSIQLFDSLKIFNANELEGRYEVDLQTYISEIQIESRTLGDMALNHIIPTAIQFQNTLLENINGFKGLYGAQYKKHTKEQSEILECISEHISEIKMKTTAMVVARKQANAIENIEQKALAYAKKINPLLSSLRHNWNQLELAVDDGIWPLAKYRELLFIR